MDLQLSNECSCQEFCVLDLVVLVSVQALEHFLSLGFAHIKLFTQQGFEVRKGDGTLLFAVNRQELAPQLVSILRSKRPSHHREDVSTEQGCLRKVPETVQGRHVQDPLLGPISLLDPRMLQSLLSTQPLVWVHNQQRLDEVLGPGRKPMIATRPVDVSDGNFLKDLLVRSEEGWSTRQKHVRNNAQRPHIRLLCVRFLQDLGGDIVDRPASLGHGGRCFSAFGESEVDDFEVVRVLTHVEEIFQLQVTVGDPVSMEVRHGQEHLSHCLGSSLLCVVLLLCQAIVHFASSHVLHYQVQVLFCLIDHLKASDVRMVQGEVDFGFALQLGSSPSREPGLLEALHRVLLAIGASSGEPHGSAHAAAQDPGFDVEVRL
mmetsp:Transcript_21096/g.45724  ORF Transcript_21096/g.45724 Transcript_21096/m.45724 type:complete len:374 (+) Transcript_21096:1190-2311(+)